MASRVCVAVPRPPGFSQAFILQQVDTMEKYQPAWLIEQARGHTAIPGDPAVLGPADPFRRQVVRLFPPSARSLARDVTQRLEPDLVHAHFGYTAAALLHVLRDVGRPWFVTFHGSDATRTRYTAFPPPPSEILLRRRWTEVGKEAHTIVAVSDYVRGRLLARGLPPAKVVRHYIGVDTQRFVPLADLAQQDRSDVLFVGRVTEQKGVDVLVRAWCHVSSALRARHRLRIVGDGPLAAPLRAATVGDAIVWDGVLSQKDVAEAMRRAALVVSPSRTGRDGAVEGLALVNLEAQACGVPVVTSYHGGITEAVEHERTGLVVEEGNVSALTGALESLLSEPMWREEMGAEGRRRTEVGFDLRQQTSLLEQMYDRALEGLS